MNASKIEHHPEVKNSAKSVQGNPKTLARTKPDVQVNPIRAAAATTRTNPIPLPASRPPTGRPPGTNTLKNLFCHNKTAVMLRLHFKALFEAQKFVCIYKFAPSRWCKYVHLKTHRVRQVIHQILGIIFWQLCYGKISFTAFVAGVKQAVPPSGINNINLFCPNWERLEL